MAPSATPHDSPRGQRGGSPRVHFHFVQLWEGLAARARPHSNLPVPGSSSHGGRPHPWVPVKLVLLLARGLLRTRASVCSGHCPRAGAAGRDQGHGRLGRNLCLLSASTAAGLGVPLPQPPNLTVRFAAAGWVGPAALSGAAFGNTSGCPCCGEDRVHGAGPPPSTRAPGRGAWAKPASDCGPQPRGCPAGPGPWWPPPGRPLPGESPAPRGVPASLSLAGTEARPRVSQRGAVPVQCLAAEPSPRGQPWWPGSRWAVAAPSNSSSLGHAPRRPALMLCVRSTGRGHAVSVCRLVAWSVGGAFSGSQCGPAGGR